MQDEENPKCKKYFERYLSLDKNEIVPFRVCVHILFCARCRTAVRSMSSAERLLRHKMEESSARKAKPASPKERPQGERAARVSSSRDPIVEAALKQIKDAGLAYPRIPVPGRVSLARWVACGLALILCLAAFPFTAMGKWAVAVLGGRFVISFYITMGLAVAAYGVIFIASNLDFFVKRINARQKDAEQESQKKPLEP